MSILRSLRSSEWVQALCIAGASLLLLVLIPAKRAELPVASGTRLVVADFLNETGNPHLGAELKALLELDLCHSTHLRFYPDSTLRHLLGRDANERITPALAAEFCTREGIPALLQPAVRRIGSTFVLSAGLVAVRRGGGFREVPVEFVQASGEGDLLSAVAGLGIRVREQLGESPAALAATRGMAPAWISPNAEATRLFAKALASGRKNDGDGELALLEQAVMLDHGFALAQMYLSARYQMLGRSADAVEHVALAKENARTLPPKDRHGILAAYYTLTHEYAEAMQQWESLARIYPDDWSTHCGLAHTALLMGRMAQGLEESLTAARLDGSQVAAQLELSLAQLFNQNSRGARQAWQRAADLEPDNSDVICMGGMVDLVENNLASALQAFKRVSSNPSGAIRSRGMFLRAQAQIYGGRLQSAVETLRTGIEEDVSRGNLSLAADKRLALSQVYLLLEDRDSALSECRKISSLQGDAARMAGLGAVYARLSCLPEAAELLTQIERLPRSPHSLFHAEVLRGEMELAAKHPERAVQALSRAKEFDATSPLEPLARALVFAGRSDEAAREYRAVCGQKAAMMFPFQRAWFMGTWVRAQYDAGVCLDNLGRRSEAKQYLRSYLWALEGADPSLGTLEPARALLKEPVGGRQ